MEDFSAEGSTKGNGKNGEMSLDSLLDIPVDISVEIGRARMPIGNLLSLSKGSIVELNKLTGESADIYVNEKLVGKGEVVVANERLGIRVVEIVTPKERVQKLG